MSKDSHQWRHMSALTRQMLSLAPEAADIGCAPELARAFLAKNACPDIKPFYDLLVAFTGLHLTARHWLPDGELSLLKIDNGVKVFEDEQTAEWRMFIGESSELGLFMTTTGAVYLSHASGLKIWLSESIESLIESVSVVWNANREGMAIDFLSTSISDAPLKLLQHFAIPKYDLASDKYLSWWRTDQCGIGRRLTFGKRFWITAIWNRGDQEFERLWTSESSNLLEPHLKSIQQSSEHKHFRETGENKSLLSWYKAGNAVTPAVSFRMAARSGLLLVAERGAISVPPDSDTDFYRYLHSTIGIAKSMGDSEAIYYCSVGLLSFGVVDAVDDVFEHMPRNTSFAWGEPLWAVAFLRFLFPFGLQFCPLHQTERAKQWFDEFRSLLQWSESKGQYSLQAP